MPEAGEPSSVADIGGSLNRIGPARNLLGSPLEAFMKTPVQITFRGIETSPTVEDYVRRRAAKLETFSGHITRCRVVVEAPHQRHRHGEPYRVRVEVTVPGANVVVGDHPIASPRHRDVHAAIDDAFDDAGRVLQDRVQRLRGDTKVHQDQG
jgi:ribosomal subunit interface protein